MTSAPRPRHTVSNHTTAARSTEHGRTQLCKFKKWHHEHRKKLWETEASARNLIKSMLITFGDAIPVHEANPYKHILQPANPHKPS